MQAEFAIDEARASTVESDRVAAAGRGATEPPPTRDDLERPGVVVDGRFELVSVLGHGGMGTVWRARQVALARDVALKLLALSESHAPRLREEALALAQLRHPNIVSVIDFGSDARGRPYLAMELVEGESLERRLARTGPLGAAEALRLLDPVLDALGYAHRRGVIHRDLKPSNVLLDGAGHALAPKLVDFGIALRLAPDAARLTGTNVIGTPAYMAPEQIRGERVDARTDVWGVAALLYELIEGEPPFGIEDPYSVLARVVSGAPRTPTGALAQAPALWAALLAALSKAPSARPQSMTALRERLAESLDVRPRAEVGSVAMGAATMRSGETMPAPAPTPTPARASNDESIDALIRARLGDA
jgi:serine/threonine protein kinase